MGDLDLTDKQLEELDQALKRGQALGECLKQERLKREALEAGRKPSPREQRG